MVFRGGPLVRNPRSLLARAKIDIAVLKSIRRHMFKIRTIEQISGRTIKIQTKAFQLLNQLERRVDTYEKMTKLTGKYNSYVAELLIVRDYDIRKAVAPPQIAYLKLQSAAHHIILGSEHKNYLEQFNLLAKKVKNGWWEDYDSMPCMMLFGELHGLSPETLKKAYAMRTAKLNLVENFTPTLTQHIAKGKKDGTFAELFRLHKEFYQQHMSEPFYKGKVFDALGGKSLEEWLDEMIKIAEEIDLQTKPKP
jgi:hypothetical protein